MCIQQLLFHFLNSYDHLFPLLDFSKSYVLSIGSCGQVLYQFPTIFYSNLTLQSPAIYFRLYNSSAFSKSALVERDMSGVLCDMLEFFNLHEPYK